MAFDTIDLASEVGMPDNHITAISLRCFAEDPYVYYQTYVKHTLEEPPIIRHPAEMLFKYMLLNGPEKYATRFKFDSPINKTTKRPFGADTDKFKNWCKEVRSDGYRPVHHEHHITAKTQYDAAMSQIDDGFLPDLKRLLEPGGQVGIQGVANVCENNCYAYSDFISRNGELVKVITVPYLSDNWYFNQNELMAPCWYSLAFSNLVFNKLGNVSDHMFTIISEYAAPYRIMLVAWPYANEYRQKFGQDLLKLNNAYGDKTKMSWKSKWH